MTEEIDKETYMALKSVTEQTRVSTLSRISTVPQEKLVAAVRDRKIDPESLKLLRIVLT